MNIGVVKWIVVVVLVVGFVYLFETWGLIWLFIGIMLLAGFRFWKMKDSFMIALRNMEYTIFKKPLDKEMWGKGEMRNTEIKMNYKGKPITNKMMSALFFALFVIFFGLFAWNKYTINILMAFFCLQLSVGFKTWDVIRSVDNARNR